jgi:hypothetical protein
MLWLEPTATRSRRAINDIIGLFSFGPQVTYGPLKDIAAFEEKMAMEHYKSNSPFLTVYDVCCVGTARHARGPV